MDGIATPSTGPNGALGSDNFDDTSLRNIRDLAESDPDTLVRLFAKAVLRKVRMARY
jgi:hypothetical protein